MKVQVFESKEALYNEASKHLIEKVKKNPNTHLGLATGSTPIPLYKKMIEDHKLNKTSYKNVKSFNLDEYIGLERTNEQSYFTFMHENLFNHIDIENINLPNGNAEDINLEAKRYTELLEANGIDLQVLGLGANGHIGFNEPNTPFESTTHIVDLDKKTIEDNARFFEGDLSKVPTKAITMGIANIMAAKEIILIATGVNKADAVYEMVKGEITEKVPATILQKHDNVVIYLDKEAASKL